MKFFFTLLVTFFFSAFFLISQPSIQWQKSIGGSGCEESYSIQQTYDGGYIVAGSTGSFNSGDVTGSLGGWDYWIVKLNSVGNIQWEKCLGGTNYDYAFSIQQTTDNGFVVAGKSISNDINVSGNHGNTDAWIVKLDSIGNILWNKCYGGSNNEAAQSIYQTFDGGYIVAGFSDSNDGDLTLNQGGTDYWIFKLDGLGNLIWQKSFGGSIEDKAWSIHQTSDGGYIIGGETNSINGDVSGNHGNLDYWIIKLNESGDTVQWKKTFGGSGEDRLFSIKQTFDDGYIVAGESSSIDGDVLGNHNVSGSTSDFWIVKLDSLGNIHWSRCLGGTAVEVAYTIQQTIDSGYVIAGLSTSNDGDVSGNIGQDYWIVKLHNLGFIEWQNCYGGTLAEVAQSIQPTTDGGYIIVGESFSYDIDVSGNHGCTDNWVVKLDSSYTVNAKDISNITSSFKVIPNPFSNVANLIFNLPISSNTKVEIRNMDGRLIKTLIGNGSDSLYWDAVGNSGEKVETGLYYLSIISNNYFETQKVVYLGNY
jgi:hypothetical protein